MPALLLGTSVSGRADAAAREAPAQASLAALHAAGAARCVNVTFAGDPPAAGVLDEHAALQLDARTVTGVDGPRKPVVSEMLDALASEAERLGIPRIGVVNGDIVVTPAAVEQAATTRRPALAFSRTDTGSGEPDSELLYGADMFTFAVEFWRRERKRFRAYILGDAVWDNVYASVIACHGGALLNRERWILHQRHPAVFRDSPYAPYLQLLAARDSSYFSLWCAYVARAEALRARGGTGEEEDGLQREVFKAPGFRAEVYDVARAAWWRARQGLGA